MIIFLTISLNHSNILNLYLFYNEYINEVCYILFYLITLLFKSCLLHVLKSLIVYTVSYYILIKKEKYFRFIRELNKC
jgi:hypothetical protein